jgi:hypothetical protein
MAGQRRPGGFFIQQRVLHLRQQIHLMGQRAERISRSAARSSMLETLARRCCHKIEDREAPHTLSLRSMLKDVFAGIFTTECQFHCIPERLFTGLVWYKDSYEAS